MNALYSTAHVSTVLFKWSLSADVFTLTLKFHCMQLLQTSQEDLDILLEYPLLDMEEARQTHMQHGHFIGKQ